MASRKHTTVVNVTFQGAEWDFDRRVSLAGERFRLVRVGTSGDTDAAERHVLAWSTKADAIALSGLREARAAGHFFGDVEELQRVQGATTQVPVRGDALFADIFQEWAIRRVEAEMPGYFANARVVVVGGTTRERTVAVLHEFTDNIVFDEAGHDLVLPARLKTNPVTASAAELGERAWRQVPGFVKDQVAGPVGWFTDRIAHQAAHDADVIIGSYSELIRFGLPDLAGKAVITSTVSEGRLAALRDRGADLVVDVTPQPFGFVVVPAMFARLPIVSWIALLPAPPTGFVTVGKYTGSVADAEPTSVAESAPVFHWFE